MEYFLVEKEKRPDNFVRLPKSWVGGPHVCLMDFPEDARFPDLVCRERPLVSEPLKKVLGLYEPELEWELLALADPGRGESRIYFYAKNLPEISCIHETTEYTESRRVRRLVLNQGAMAGRSFFWVRAPRETFLIVRLDVAESMLRRDLYGFCLKRVACVREE